VAYREVGEKIGYESLRLRADWDGFPIPADQRARIEKSFQDRLAQALDDSANYRRMERARGAPRGHLLRDTLTRPARSAPD
jgi:hypothetical protein